MQTFSYACKRLPTQLPSQLLKKLMVPGIEGGGGGEGKVLLVSNNFDWEEIHVFLDKVNTSSSKGGSNLNEFKENIQLIGGVVDTINGGAGFCLTSLPPMDSSSLLFYSPPGTVRRAKSVGRWHVSDLKSVGEKNFLMKDFKSVSQSPLPFNPNVIPEALKDFKLKSSYSGGAILTLGDSEPYDLYSYLNHTFPHTSKMGLIAAKTPFLNGKIHSLFVDNRVVEGGSVGILIPTRKEGGRGYNVQHNLNDCLYPLDNPVIEGGPCPGLITKARGNIVLEIDGKPASSLLNGLVARDESGTINRRLIARLSSENQDKGGNPGRGGSRREIFSSITGGAEGKKGALALETFLDLSPEKEVEGAGGMFIKFYRAYDAPLLHHQKSDDIESCLPLQFTSLAKQEDGNDSPTPSHMNREMSSIREDGPCIVGSEEGFLLSDPLHLLADGGGVEVCTIPHAIVRISSEWQ